MFLGKRDRLCFFWQALWMDYFWKIFCRHTNAINMTFTFQHQVFSCLQDSNLFLVIICCVQNPAPMRRCGPVQYIWYPGSNCNVWGCDVYRNGLHTVVPERLQSSFGLLRMSHLLPQISFAPLMYSHPLCILASFTFSSCLSPTLCTSRLCSRSAHYEGPEWENRVGELKVWGHWSAASHPWSARLITQVWPASLRPPRLLPRNRLNTWEWPALDFMLHWTLNKLEEGHPQTANCKKHMVY